MTESLTYLLDAPPQTFVNQMRLMEQGATRFEGRMYGIERSFRQVAVAQRRFRVSGDQGRMALTQLGYAVNDVQAGINGGLRMALMSVSNNLTQIAVTVGARGGTIFLLNVLATAAVFMGDKLVDAFARGSKAAGDAKKLYDDAAKAVLQFEQVRGVTIPTSMLPRAIGILERDIAARNRGIGALQGSTAGLTDEERRLLTAGAPIRPGSAESDAVREQLLRTRGQIAANQEAIRQRQAMNAEDQKLLDNLRERAKEHAAELRIAERLLQVGGTYTEELGKQVKLIRGRDGLFRMEGAGIQGGVFDALRPEARGLRGLGGGIAGELARAEAAQWMLPAEGAFGELPEALHDEMEVLDAELQLGLASMEVHWLAHADRVGAHIERIGGVAGQVFGGFADLAQAAFEASGEHSRAYFSWFKRLAVAEALANTAVAVTQALRSGPPPWNFAAAAAVGAAGLAQVIRISSMSADGGGASGAVSSVRGYGSGWNRPAVAATVYGITPQPSGAPVQARLVRLDSRTLGLVVEAGRALDQAAGRRS